MTTVACIGGDVDGIDHTVPAGAKATVDSLDWLRGKTRLSITIAVSVPGETDSEGDPITIVNVFDECDEAFGFKPIKDSPGEKTYRISARAISHLTRTFEVSAENEQAAHDKARTVINGPFWTWDQSDPEDEQIESIEEVT